MRTREIQAKSILSPSKVYPYVINPYIGCRYACAYCYARFMRRFTGHREPWGEFIDIKINAAYLLQHALATKKKAEVWISGVCDPYQPVESKYKLTRQCLALLVQHNWPVRIQTKSDLVLRDIDLCRMGKDLAVGFSISTADDKIRAIFEPRATPIAKRINALAQLRQAGIRTYAMLAPLLPGAEQLIPALAGKVEFIYLDRMNYNHAHRLYRQYHLEKYLRDDYFRMLKEHISRQAGAAHIHCHACF